jgi:hypothetical protein
MLRDLFIIILLTLSISPSALAQLWFDGEPDYVDEDSKALASKLLEAHGGMEPMNSASSLQFNFFTKMIGNPTPFYSFETLDLDSGRAYVDWPFWNATIGWDREQVWSRNWPMPLPAGFFVRLTSSFLTLPWQMHADNANIARAAQAKLPEDETLYDILRITYDNRNPGIPGTFYEVFIHPETSPLSTSPTAAAARRAARAMPTTLSGISAWISRSMGTGSSVQTTPPATTCRQDGGSPRPVTVLTWSRTTFATLPTRLQEVRNDQDNHSGTGAGPVAPTVGRADIRNRGDSPGHRGHG